MTNEAVVTKPYWINQTSPLFAVEHQLISGNLKDTAVIILNSGFLHNVGPYRLHIDIANLLSLQGYTVIRLDQSGKGESSARPDVSGLEAKLLDYDEIFQRLAIDYGISHCVLIGLCSGADDALEIAEVRHSVSGLIFLDGFSPVTNWYYANHYLTRLCHLNSWLRSKIRVRKSSKVNVNSSSGMTMSLRRWASEESVKNVYESVLNRGVKALAIFTGSTGDYYNHRGQLSRGLSVSTDNLTEIYFRDATHIYPLPAQRRLLVEGVASWVRSQFPG